MIFFFSNVHDVLQIPFSNYIGELIMQIVFMAITYAKFERNIKKT